MKRLTEARVRREVNACANGIIREFRTRKDADRETVIEWLETEVDNLWGELVQSGRITDYDASDLVATAPACASIIAVAETDAWVEDDSGLWEGLTFGVLASMAYFSLRNLVYSRLKNKGFDTNDDRPFER